MSKIFIDNVTAKDEDYITVRDVENEICKHARVYTENLWDKFRQYADVNFLVEIRNDFDSRFWEMYLTISLLNQNWELKCQKPGPDILLEINNRSKIWIEAVAPSGGNKSNPDSVPGIELGKAQDVPDDQITLRIRSVIEEKYMKYKQYRENEIISNNDSYIIAINACKINSSHLETGLPRIVRSVFPIGFPTISRDLEDPDRFIHGNTYSPSITKNNNAVISTNIFLEDEYRYLSAVLYSNVNACRLTQTMGTDYILVHNPKAINPCKAGFLGIGQDYTAQILADQIKISSKNLNDNRN